MSIIDSRFWQASVQELKQGYSYDCVRKTYTCLICGQIYNQGVIYPHQELLLEAERAAENHVHAAHGPMFAYLLNLDKKFTGLSEVQRKLLLSFYQGQSDREISVEHEGSASTIRNHRFKLREREKQARVFLALMELLEHKDDFIPIHKGATMVDERYIITEEERNKVLKNYIRDGKLTAFPAKEKRKLMILQFMVEKFEPNREYTEKEVNAILAAVCPDHVTIRRYLIEYGFMTREIDGSSYRVKV